MIPSNEELLKEITQKVVFTYFLKLDTEAMG